MARSFEPTLTAAFIRRLPLRDVGTRTRTIHACSPLTMRPHSEAALKRGPCKRTCTVPSIRFCPLPRKITRLRLFHPLAAARNRSRTVGRTLTAADTTRPRAGRSGRGPACRFRECERRLIERGLRHATLARYGLHRAGLDLTLVVPRGRCGNRVCARRLTNGKLDYSQPLPPGHGVGGPPPLLSHSGICRRKIDIPIFSPYITG